MLTRRNLFLLSGAALAGLRRSYAFSSDFWDKKPPADWTNEEIDRLITKSPWAKEVNAQYAQGQAPSSGSPNGTGYPGGGYPGGGSPTGYPGGGGGGIGGVRIPGIGGIGIPGVGGVGGGRGNRGGRGGQTRGGQGSAFHGTVRWESARPVLDALKSPLPEDFENRYVISVSGIPLLSDRYQGQDRGEDDTAPNLDNLKAMTSLQPKGKDLVQAGVVKRQVGTGTTILFGFSRELLSIDKHDSEVLFASQMGRLIVKARFTPKEMLYHGDLAV